MLFRRLILATVISLVPCTTAFAVVKGWPTSASVVATTGTVALNDGALGALPVSLTNSMTPGSVDKFTLGAGAASVTIEFAWNSPQDFHRGAAAGAPNFAIYLGTSIFNAVNSGGSANFTAATSIAYSEDSGATFPVTAFAGVTLDASAGALPHRTLYFTINASASGQDQVDAVRVVFSQTSGTTNFFLAAVQNPEPATWALFALGLGGLGVAARRRKAAAAKRKAA